MADLHQNPDADSAPVESRRAGLGQIDPAQPTAPDAEPPTAPDLPEFGEFAAESARPTPLDDIAKAEREQMPRD